MALVLVLINRLGGMALPMSTKLVIDSVIGGRRPELLLPIAAGTGVAILVGATSGVALAWVISHVAHRATAELRRDLHSHILRCPVSFFDATPTGSVTARLLTDAEQLRFVVGAGAVQLMSGTITAMIGLGVLFYLNWRVTVAVAALLVALAVGVGRGLRRCRTEYHGVSEAMAGLTMRLTESLAGVRVIKSCGAERTAVHAFTRATHQLLRATVRTTRSSALLGGAATLGIGTMTILLIVTGSKAVASGAMTLGDAGMYMAVVAVVTAPVLQLAALAGEVGRTVAALGRIGELRELATEHDDGAHRATITTIVGDVTFDNVSYAYTGERTVLRGVSFVATAGTTTALVGPSGAGKSTICRLLLAFDNPGEGRVLVDGRDLATVRRRDYRRQLGVVLQDPFLFDGSVADNIRYGVPRATTEMVRRVARLAYCDEFIDRLPYEYDTVVGERGVRLSVGQRQRIVIARALLRDPRLLILDEATSSLDSESELLIQAALQALTQGRTTVVVAHRLATVQRAEQILVLDDGVIVERGTHEQLLIQDGSYARACEAQRRLGLAGNGRCAFGATTNETVGDGKSSASRRSN